MLNCLHAESSNIKSSVLAYSCNAPVVHKGSCLDAFTCFCMQSWSTHHLDRPSYIATATLYITTGLVVALT